MSNRGGHFETFIFGAVVGGILGLLFAPAPGEETRKKLRQMHDENEELIENTKVKTESLINKTREAIEEGFDKLTEMIDQKKKQLDSNNK